MHIKRIDVVFLLERCILVSFLQLWIDIGDICRLDSSLVSNEVERALLHQIMQNNKLTFTGFNPSRKFNIFAYYNWVTFQRVKVNHFISLKHAYKVLCKTIPSLYDAVGSIDNNVSREKITEPCCSGLVNYSVTSMEDILSKMFIPVNGKGARILDARCGNAYFITLSKMCFFEAEVVGVELPPMVTTLRSIQRYTRCELFKNITFNAADIQSKAFTECVQHFLPSHLVCFSALKDDEIVLLTVGKHIASVQVLVLAEQRNPVVVPDFELYGFTQAHRLVVQIPGSRKKRYVLIATRNQSSEDD